MTRYICFFIFLLIIGTAFCDISIIKMNEPANGWLNYELIESKEKCYSLRFFPVGYKNLAKRYEWTAASWTVGDPNIKVWLLLPEGVSLEQGSVEFQVIDSDKENFSADNWIKVEGNQQSSGWEDFNSSLIFSTITDLISNTVNTAILISSFSEHVGNKQKEREVLEKFSGSDYKAVKLNLSRPKVNFCAVDIKFSLDSDSVLEQPIGILMKADKRTLWGQYDENFFLLEFGKKDHNFEDAIEYFPLKVGNYWDFLTYGGQCEPVHSLDWLYQLKIISEETRTINFENNQYTGIVYTFEGRLPYFFDYNCFIHSNIDIYLGYIENDSLLIDKCFLSLKHRKIYFGREFKFETLNDFFSDNLNIEGIIYPGYYFKDLIKLTYEEEYYICEVILAKNIGLIEYFEAEGGYDVDHLYDSNLLNNINLDYPIILNESQYLDVPDIMTKIFGNWAFYDECSEYEKKFYYYDSHKEIILNEKKTCFMFFQISNTKNKIVNTLHAYDRSFGLAQFEKINGNMELVNFTPEIGSMPSKGKFPDSEVIKLGESNYGLRFSISDMNFGNTSEFTNIVAKIDDSFKIIVEEITASSSYTEFHSSDYDYKADIIFNRNQINNGLYNLTLDYSGTINKNYHEHQYNEIVEYAFDGENYQEISRSGWKEPEIMVIFEDDFNGNFLDNTKWEIFKKKGNVSLDIENGYLELNGIASGDHGIGIMSKESFTYPILIEYRISVPGNQNWLVSGINEGGPKIASGKENHDSRRIWFNGTTYTDFPNADNDKFRKIQIEWLNNQEVIFRDISVGRERRIKTDADKKYGDKLMFYAGDIYGKNNVMRIDYVKVMKRNNN